MTAHTFLIEVEQMDHCSSAMCCVCMLFPFVHSMCVSGQLQRSLSVCRSQGSWALRLNSLHRCLLPAPPQHPSPKPPLPKTWLSTQTWRWAALRSWS